MPDKRSLLQKPLHFDEPDCSVTFSDFQQDDGFFGHRTFQFTHSLLTLNLLYFSGSAFLAMIVKSYFKNLSGMQRVFHHVQYRIF